MEEKPKRVLKPAEIKAFDKQSNAMALGVVNAFFIEMAENHDNTVCQFFDKTATQWMIDEGLMADYTTISCLIHNMLRSYKAKQYNWKPLASALLKGCKEASNGQIPKVLLDV